MPTHRTPGGKGTQFRKNYETYLEDFGTTVTLRTSTRTLDSNGRTTATSTTTKTIKADIQWYTKKDLDKGNLGNVKVGDGMLFVKHDSGIDIDDDTKFYEVEYNSEYWRVLAQIEGEQVGGRVIYQCYNIRKDSQL